MVVGKREVAVIFWFSCYKKREEIGWDGEKMQEGKGLIGRFAL
jgi:hypothetical protein